MKAANDAPVRAGNAVLRESGRVDAGRSGDFDVEGSAEEAAFIDMRVGRNTRTPDSDAVSTSWTRSPLSSLR